ncbi:MAG: hypothetical protein ACK4NO_04015 [Glycocaulis sp.]
MNPREESSGSAENSPRISASFLARLQPLIWRSADIASVIRSKLSENTSSTGRRREV